MVSFSWDHSQWAQHPAFLISMIAFIVTAAVIYLTDSGTGVTTTVGTFNQEYMSNSLSQLLEVPGSKKEETSNSGIISLDIWKKDYAYVQYAEDQDSICNSVMIFEQLERSGSKAARVLVYPNSLGVPSQEPNTRDRTVTKLLRQARDKYDVRLKPLNFETDSSQNKDALKLLIGMNQTEYKRVISIDPQCCVLKSLDSLFIENIFTKNTKLAAPYAYWLPQLPTSIPLLTSSFMVIEPSAQEFEQAVSAGQHSLEAKPDNNDFIAINDIYNESMTALPQRGYTMLTSELRTSDHTFYLGSFDTFWDAVTELRVSYCIRFSDEYPKVRK